MFLASSAGEVLFSREEADILLHRPIGPRILFRSEVRRLAFPGRRQCGTQGTCGYSGQSAGCPHGSSARWHAPSSGRADPHCCQARKPDLLVRLPRNVRLDGRGWSTMRSPGVWMHCMTNCDSRTTTFLQMHKSVRRCGCKGRCRRWRAWRSSARRVRGSGQGRPPSGTRPSGR